MAMPRAMIIPGGSVVQVQQTGTRYTLTFYSDPSEIAALSNPCFTPALAASIAGGAAPDVSPKNSTFQMEITHDHNLHAHSGRAIHRAKVGGSTARVVSHGESDVLEDGYYYWVQ